jgi:hypothetical protein
MRERSVLADQIRITPDFSPTRIDVGDRKAKSVGSVNPFARTCSVKPAASVPSCACFPSTCSRSRSALSFANPLELGWRSEPIPHWYLNLQSAAPVPPPATTIAPAITRARRRRRRGIRIRPRTQPRLTLATRSARSR